MFSIFKSGSTLSDLGRGSGLWSANLFPKSHGSFGVGPLGLSLVNMLIVSSIEFCSMAAYD